MLLPEHIIDRVYDIAKYTKSHNDPEAFVRAQVLLLCQHLLDEMCEYHCPKANELFE